ncbi:MAG TPA: glycosyltransferase family 4 protein [Phycisphaerae bacterium]|nr:glycosyltransferase family 4 protein [Phycisphaerae bacterium]
MGDAPLRIALVVEHMDPVRGGCETYTAWIASALAERGHDVTIICHDNAWETPGVDFAHVRRRGTVRTSELRNFAADVRAAVEREGFDVVHAMLPVDCASIYQPHSGTMPGRREASLRRRRGLKWVSACITGKFNHYRRFLSRMERRLVANPDTICLCVSETVAEQFRRHFGRTERLRVVFNGVKVPDAAPAVRGQWRQRARQRVGAGERDAVFLTVATNFVLKGVAPTIEAFARWAQRERGREAARLVVIGRDAPSRYIKLAAAQGVGRQVKFLPYTDELFHWYSAADACVLLSWYDSCSLVVLEAAAWGVPSITTVFNGAAEVLSGGGGIVVASPRDTGAVVRAMEELADPRRRGPRAEACLGLGERLKLDRHVNELLEVYDEARRIR